MKFISLVIFTTFGLLSFQSNACTTYQGQRVCAGDIITNNGATGVVTYAYNGRIDVDWYNRSYDEGRYYDHGRYHNNYDYRYYDNGRYYNNRDYRYYDYGRYSNNRDYRYYDNRPYYRDNQYNDYYYRNNPNDRRPRYPGQYSFGR